MRYVDNNASINTISGVDAFNVLNHTDFGIPNKDWKSSSGGKNHQFGVIGRETAIRRRIHVLAFCLRSSFHDWTLILGNRVDAMTFYDRSSARAGCGHLYRRLWDTVMEDTAVLCGFFAPNKRVDVVGVYVFVKRLGDYLAETGQQRGQGVRFGGGEG